MICGIVESGSAKPAANRVVAWKIRGTRKNKVDIKLFVIVNVVRPLPFKKPFRQKTRLNKIQSGL